MKQLRRRGNCRNSRKLNQSGLGITRKRGFASRPLFAEPLEDRRLLTTIGGQDYPFHNHAIAADVSGDWVVTPRDALLVINEINRGGSRRLDTNEGETGSLQTLNFVDTNRDSRLSPIDALLVINSLNRGEAEGPLVAFRLEAQGLSGNFLPNNRVRVGDEFVLQAYVQDLRPGSEATGVFAAYLDIEYNDEELFSLGGTSVSDFSSLPPFHSFWTQGSSYSQPGEPSVWPWDFEIDGTLRGQPVPGEPVPNEFDELGSFAKTFLLDGAEYKLMSVRLKAEQTGVLTFAGNPAELLGREVPLLDNQGNVVGSRWESEQSDTLLFDSSFPVPIGLIDYGFEIQVTITQPVNAQDDPATVLEDGSVPIDVLANDFLEQGSTGTLAILPGGFTGPSNGTVTIVAGKVVYTPAPDYFGPDSFIYTAIDGPDNSDTATVTVDVLPVNDPPIAVNDTVTSIPEDSVDNVLNVMANDSPGPGEGAIDSISLASVGIPNRGGTAVKSGNVVLYTPAPNFFGTETFTYTIADSSSLTASATVTVVVDPVNDPPIAVDDTFTGIQEGSSNHVLNVLVNDSPGPGEQEIDSIILASVGTPSQGGTAVTSGNGILYTPAPNFFGTETFTYAIADSMGLQDTALVTVVVDNVNDAPIASDDLVFVDEFSLDNELLVLQNDSPGPNEELVDNIRIIAVTVPDQGGTVTIAPDGKSLVYAPADDLFGPETETFQYTIQDNFGLADTATVTVEIEPVTRPRARDDRYDVLEDSLLANNLFDVTANDLFNEGATRSPIVIVTPPQHGVAQVVEELSIRYQPNPDYFGADTLEYQIGDSGVGSLPDIGLARINVLPVNDPPIAEDDPFTAILEDSVNNVLNVLANDSPGPGESVIDSITIQGVGTPDQGGTVTIAADGKSLRYTPATHFFGTERFAYTIVDTGGLTDSALATVVVDNVNDPPIALPNTFTGILEDSVNNTLDVMANDSPGPGEEAVDSISLLSVGTPSRGGTAGISGNVIHYTPAPDFFGTETLMYTITDSHGLTATATVTVVVDDVNDQPIAGDDDDATALKDFANQPLTGLLANDSPGPFEEAIDSIRIVGVGNFSDGGSATFSDDTIFYTPAAGFEGIETFDYTVEDSGELTATATVTVEVIDAVPSDISGVAYMDTNNNGVVDNGEPRLAGVAVTLVGTNIRGQEVNLTVKSDVNGEFVFKNILPNIDGDPHGYSIYGAQPKFAIDGKDAVVDGESVGDFQPGVAGNDVITGIHLGLWGTDRSQMNYTFGERGLKAKYISIGQYLSSSNTGLAIATNLNKDADSDDYWYTVLKNWDGIGHARVKLAQDLRSAQLTIWNQNGQSQTRTITYHKFFMAGDQATGEYVIYFNGSAADLGFDILGDLTAAAGWSGNSHDPALGEPGDMIGVGAVEYTRGVDQVFGSGDWVWATLCDFEPSPTATPHPEPLPKGEREPETRNVFAGNGTRT